MHICQIPRNSPHNTSPPPGKRNASCDTRTTSAPQSHRRGTPPPSSAHPYMTPPIPSRSTESSGLPPPRGEAYGDFDAVFVLRCADRGLEGPVEAALRRVDHVEAGEGDGGDVVGVGARGLWAIMTVMDAALGLESESESSGMAAMAATRFPHCIFWLSLLAMASAILPAQPLNSFYSASATKEKGKENCNALDTNPRHVIVIAKIENPIRSRPEPD